MRSRLRILYITMYKLRSIKMQLPPTKHSLYVAAPAATESRSYIIAVAGGALMRPLFWRY